MTLHSLKVLWSIGYEYGHTSCEIRLTLGRYHHHIIFNMVWPKFQNESWLRLRLRLKMSHGLKITTQKSLPFRFQTVTIGDRG